MKRGLLIAVAVTLVALAAAPSALARQQLLVDDDRHDCPRADFTTIQAAVDAAPPGSRVSVCAGTYREQVDIATDAKDGLRVVARDGPEKVVLEGDRSKTHGFLLRDVSEVLVRGFTVRQYVEDIHLLRSDHNTIVDNVTKDTFVHDGIVLRFSDHNRIERNVAFNTMPPGGCGIALAAGSSFNVVRDNVTFANPSAGILLSPLPAAVPGVGPLPPEGVGVPPGPGNVVEHNVSRDNPGFGIRNVRAPETRIQRNLVVRNGAPPVAAFPAGRDGIAVSGTESRGLVVARNRVFENAKDGIFLSVETSGNSVVGNRIRRNGEHDCHDDSVGHVRSGVANRWEKNKGQTENRPGLCGKK